MPDRTTCDLVMKGGITSGVVYPAAVLELSKDHDFGKVGGTSAGAIAAVVTAAAQSGRRQGHDGFATLKQVTDDLGKPGFLEGLFQATPKARPVLDGLLRALKEGRGKVGRLVDLALLVLRLRWWALLLAFVLGVGLAAVVGVAVANLPLVPAVLAAVVGLVAVACVVGAVLGLAVAATGLGLKRALDAHGFGMCPGTPQEGYDGRPALSPWLHERVQAAAGLPLDRPLTFRMLEDAGVTLAMMTTDLSYARPLRLPLDEEDAAVYFFTVPELSRVIPEAVVRTMVPESMRDAPDTAFIPFPTLDLPVVVATRMSLSFPLLLSAVELHTRHETEDRLIDNWFSDGGMSSNFPIHFFDGWLPGHPTYGLDLRPYPKRLALVAEDPDAAGPDDVVMYPPETPAPPRWAEVATVGTFLRQIKDVVQNWRDNLQAGLPGFRDRICEVRLRPDEGGFNLNMDPKTIRRLMERGGRAGEALRGFDFDAHRWGRHITLMQMLQDNLQRVAPKYGAFEPDLRAGVPGVTAWRRGHDAAWCTATADEVAALLAQGARLGPPPGSVDCNQGGGVEPTPTPAMRITPRV